MFNEFLNQDSLDTNQDMSTRQNSPEKDYCSTIDPVDGGLSFSYGGDATSKMNSFNSYFYQLLLFQYSVDAFVDTLNQDLKEYAAHHPSRVSPVACSVCTTKPPSPRPNLAQQKCLELIHSSQESPMELSELGPLKYKSVSTSKRSSRRKNS